MTWPGAGSAPHYNVVGLDPRLVDPEHGDFRLEPGSPAAGYGCQTLVPRRLEAAIAPATTGSGEGARADHARSPGSVSSLAASADSHGATSPADRRRSSVAVSGPIAQDAIWDADTVRVVGDILVPDGLTLSIVPGTLVRFDGFFGLKILGRLLAVGSPQARITFASAHPELFCPDTTKAGSWNGITFPATLATNGVSSLEWCDFSGSKAVGTRPEGGVFYLDGFSGLEVRNCRFRSNLAGYGGVLFAQRGSSPVFTGCVLTENYALLRGSAVYCADGYPRLSLCTIVQNQSLNPEPFDDTGVVHAHISKPRLTGCIIRDNATSFFLGWELREAKPWYVRWSNIGAGGFPGEGDFDADPLFVQSGEHPLALGPGSPCINAGPPEPAGLALLPLDLAGQPRLSGGRIDVGAYESWAPAAAGGAAPDRGPILLSASPNPVVGATTLRFALQKAAHVRVTLWDAAGRRLGVLHNGVLSAGNQEVEWEPGTAGGPTAPTTGASGGVLFVRLEVDGVPWTAVKLVQLQ